MNTAHCKRLEQFNILFIRSKFHRHVDLSQFRKGIDFTALAGTSMELLKAQQLCTELERKLEEPMTR